MPATSFLSLPSELLHHIASLSKSHFRDAMTPQELLYNLSLTCRHLHFVTLPVLWRKPIVWTYPVWYSFFNSVKEHSELFALVQELEVDLSRHYNGVANIYERDWDWMGRQIPTLSHCRSLSISFPLPLIVAGTIQTTPNNHIVFAEVLRWIASCPNLTTLHLRNLRSHTLRESHLTTSELKLSVPSSLVNYTLDNYLLTDLDFRFVWACFPVPRALTLRAGSIYGTLNGMASIGGNIEYLTLTGKGWIRRTSLERGFGLSSVTLPWEEQPPDSIASSNAVFPMLKELRCALAEDTWAGKWMELVQLHLTTDVWDFLRDYTAPSRAIHLLHNALSARRFPALQELHIRATNVYRLSPATTLDDIAAWKSQGPGIRAICDSLDIKLVVHSDPSKNIYSSRDDIAGG